MAIPNIVQPRHQLALHAWVKLTCAPGVSGVGARHQAATGESRDRPQQKGDCEAQAYEEYGQSVGDCQTCPILGRCGKAQVR